MKTFLTLVALVFSANAFALGSHEVFDFTTGLQPSMGNLGSVCYKQVQGEDYLEAVVKENNKCVTTWEVDEDSRGDVFPHQYVLTNKQWIDQGRVGTYGARYNPVQSCTFSGYKTVTVPMTTGACLEWETYTVEPTDTYKNPQDTLIERSRCVKGGTKALPRTQRLDVYLYQVGETVLADQPKLGSDLYTIPACKVAKQDPTPEEPEEEPAPTPDVPDEELPETKK